MHTYTYTYTQPLKIKTQGMKALQKLEMNSFWGEIRTWINILFVIYSSGKAQQQQRQNKFWEKIHWMGNSLRKISLCYIFSRQHPSWKFNEFLLTLSFYVSIVRKFGGGVENFHSLRPQSMYSTENNYFSMSWIIMKIKNVDVARQK